MIDSSSQAEHQKLPASSKKVWRINNSLWVLLFWLIPAYFGVSLFFDNGYSVWVFAVSVLMALLFSVFVVITVPAIRWQQWHYRVDEYEIDLRQGIFIIRRTLIPIKRVQHVDTRQGPVLRSYGLADVVISTAATTHKIPALAEQTADKVRHDISTFARKAKEDV